MILLFQNRLLHYTDFPQYFITLQEGYVFRVTLAHKKEIALAKETRTPTGLVVSKDNAKSLELEKDIVQLPRLTSMLHG